MFVLVERLFNEIVHLLEKSIGFSFFLWVLAFLIFYIISKNYNYLIVSNKIIFIVSFLAFVFNYLLVLYMISYGKSGWQILNPAPVFFGLLAFGCVFGALKYFEYGFLFIYDSAEKGTFNKNIFFIWIGPLISVVLFYFIYTYLPIFMDLYNNDVRKNYPGYAYIKHEEGLEIYVTQFAFVDTDSGDRFEVDLNPIDHHGASDILFSGRITIPKNADFFDMSWYSFSDLTFYRDHFPLKLQKLPRKPAPYLLFKAHNQEETTSILKWFPFLIPEKIENLTFLIKSNGDVDLFSGGRTNFHYIKVETEPKAESEFVEFYEKYKNRIDKHNKGAQD